MPTTVLVCMLLKPDSAHWTMSELHSVWEVHSDIVLPFMKSGLMQGDTCDGHRQGGGAKHAC
jgi:hypothetical protein